MTATLASYEMRRPFYTLTLCQILYRLFLVCLSIYLFVCWFVCFGLVNFPQDELLKDINIGLGNDS